LAPTFSTDRTKECAPAIDNDLDIDIDIDRSGEPQDLARA
jgi:hypothetical protein